MSTARNCRSRHRTCGRKSPARPSKPWGLSLVFHPRNPYAPTTHCNVRFLIATPKSGPAVWWFGGGFDLTPYYPFDEDVLHWHQTARAACLPFGAGVYEKYKQWCDRYFFLPHRNETRGVGGLFFDDLNDGGFAHCFALLQSVGDHFLPAFMPIVERRRGLRRGATASAISNCIGAVATWSSICSTIAAPCSACSRAAAPSPSSCRCRRSPAGTTIGTRTRDPPEARLYDFLRPRDYLAELAARN